MPVVLAHPDRDVGREVPDGRVVLLDQRLQAGDRGRVRLREVDVAAPDPVPALVGGPAAQPDRLRVVDDDRVPLAFEALGVQRVDLVEQLPLLVAERVVGSLQRVVEELGRVVELFLAEDHLPVGVEAGVPHQRHDRVEDLRDAAAERGRADVQDAVALERLRERPDLLAQLLAGDVRVIGQRLVAEGDFLKHAAEFYTQLGGSARPGIGSTARIALRPGAESDVDLLGFAVLVHHFQRHRVARVRSRRSDWRGRPVRRPCGRRSRGRRRRRCGRGGPGTGSSRRRRAARLRRRDRRGRLRRAGRRSRCRGRAGRRAAGRAPGSRRRCRRIRPCRRLRAGRSSVSRR